MPLYPQASINRKRSAATINYVVAHAGIGQKFDLRARRKRTRYVPDLRNDRYSERLRISGAVLMFASSVNRDAGICKAGSPKLKLHARRRLRARRHTIFRADPPRQGLKKPAGTRCLPAFVKSILWRRNPISRTALRRNVTPSEQSPCIVPPGARPLRSRPCWQSCSACGQ